MRKTRFRVIGRFVLASRPQTATVVIDRDAGLMTVRPLRHRKIYTLPLATVAEWMVRHLIRLEVIEKRRAKKAGRKRKTKL